MKMRCWRRSRARLRSSRANLRRRGPSCPTWSCTRWLSTWRPQSSLSWRPEGPSKAMGIRCCAWTGSRVRGGWWPPLRLGRWWCGIPSLLTGSVQSRWPASRWWCVHTPWRDMSLHAVVWIISVPCIYWRLTKWKHGCQKEVCCYAHRLSVCLQLHQLRCADPEGQRRQHKCPEERREQAAAAELSMGMGARALFGPGPLRDLDHPLVQGMWQECRWVGPVTWTVRAGLSNTRIWHHQCHTNLGGDAFASGSDVAVCYLYHLWAASKVDFSLSVSCWIQRLYHQRLGCPQGVPVTSCLNMKTMLVLYVFPLMGLPLAQDHEIIPSESGVDHSGHRYLGVEFEIITCK